VKAGWQDMNEEAADELVGREPHDLLYASGLVSPDCSGVRQSSGLMTSLMMLVATRV
jgi:hypothetical protein